MLMSKTVYRVVCGLGAFSDPARPSITDSTGDIEHRKPTKVDTADHAYRSYLRSTAIISGCEITAGNVTMIAFLLGCLVIRLGPNRNLYPHIGDLSDSEFRSVMLQSVGTWVGETVGMGVAAVLTRKKFGVGVWPEYSGFMARHPGAYVLILAATTHMLSDIYLATVVPVFWR